MRSLLLPILLVASCKVVLSLFTSVINTTALNDTVLENADYHFSTEDHGINNTIAFLQFKSNLLYDNISKAIDEGLRQLENNYSTDSLKLVDKLLEFKKSLEKIQAEENLEANLEYNKTLNINDSINKTLSTNVTAPKRRKMPGVGRQMVTPPHDNEDLFDEKNVFYGPFGTRGPDRIPNYEKLQKRLEEWMEMKKRERKKLQEYMIAVKARTKIRHENCPDMGIESIGKKDKKIHFTYPCCRKCCKSSYLGCL